MRYGKEDDNRPEQGSSTANEFNSEGNINLTRLKVNEDEVFYSDPDVDSVPLKRISRKAQEENQKERRILELARSKSGMSFILGGVRGRVSMKSVRMRGAFA